MNTQTIAPFTVQERRLRGLLTLFAATFFVGAILYEIGPLVGPLREFCRRTPFVTNSVVKVATLGLIALYAAGDLRRRLGLVRILIGAHLLSIAAMTLLLILRSGTGRPVVFGGWTIPAGWILAGAIALDGCIAALLLGFYMPARAALVANREEAREEERGRSRSARRTLRIALAVLGVAFAGAAVAYELGAILPGTREFFVELPFVTNSVVKVGVLAMLCFYVLHDLADRLPVLDILITAHFVSAVAILGLYPHAGGEPAALLFGRMTTIRSVQVWAIALDSGILALLLVLVLAAWRERYDLQFLQPVEFRTLLALADVTLKGEHEAIHADVIADNVDKYVARIRAKRRWVYRVALFGIELHPLLYLKAPLSELDPETRLTHLKRHFYREVALKLVPDWWRRFVQVAIRIGKQLVYIGYYNDRRTYASVGYRPFSQRLREAGQPQPSKAALDLKVLAPGDIPRRDRVIETDVCVIGSGAAGAILAYHLAERGRNVLVLERGKFLPPEKFTEDEIEMVGGLYADGVFQQAEDFRFTILQGSCVGGSTTVNNAVCFAPPERVLDRWNDVEHDAGLDRSRLGKSVDYVSRFLCVKDQGGAPLNPSAPKFLEGINNGAPGAGRLQVGAVRANIRDCLGCGYCNIGCAYGRKLSMLQTVLPWAQDRFGDRVRILSESEAIRLRELTGTPRQILDAKVALSDRREVTVRAKTFVISSGTIASSWLLMRSGIGRDLPVGRGVSFNMGSPLTAEFEEPLDAYAGLQISHYAIPDPERGFVLETWWNPPATQAVNLPGWFEDHFENMRNYRRLMAVGVLVGTKSNAYIRPALTGGPGIVFTPEWDDLRSLADGLAQVGEILFASGARRVMANTWAYDVFTHPNQLSELYRICDDPSYITIGTGHPQGGNAVSRSRYRGVVDPEFRVHGYRNLYVCDASVFPTSLTVNPQLTVMALAHYAAGGIT